MTKKQSNKEKGRFLYSRFVKSSQPPFIILFLIKKHIVKTEDGARRLVIALIFIFLVASFCFFKQAVSSPVFIN